MTRFAIVAAVLAMTACGGTEEDSAAESGPVFPEVTESYRLDAAKPVCWDTYAEFDMDREAPPQYGCTWFNATYDGTFYSAVALRWEKQAAGWVEVYRNLIPYAPPSVPVANN